MRFFKLLAVFMTFFLYLPEVAFAQETETVPAVSVNPIEKIAGLTDSFVVTELFTSQACVFCPKADAFMKQFVKEPNIISFSCHIDYFDVKNGSLSLPDCSKRQEYFESVLKEGPKFTPQMMINGEKSVVGYRQADVWKALDTAASEPVSAAQILSGDKVGEFQIVLPDKGQDEYFLKLFQYVTEKNVKIADGGNRGKTMTYYNSVSLVKDLGMWNGEAKTVSFHLDLPHEPGGFAVLVQSMKTGKIVIAAKYTYPEKPKFDPAAQ